MAAIRLRRGRSMLAWGMRIATSINAAFEARGSGPIRIGDAFAIVKFDEKRPMVVPTFVRRKN